MPELRFTINAGVIRDNLRHSFPDEPRAELDAFALAVAEVTYHKRPCSRDFVSQYATYARRFMQKHELSPWSLRRVLATQWLQWGSLAKSHDRALALACAARVALLEPSQLSSIVLPAPLREASARRLGKFWEAASEPLAL